MFSEGLWPEVHHCWGVWKQATQFTIASKHSDHSDQTGQSGQSLRCTHKYTNHEYLASNSVLCEESQNFAGLIPKANVASFAMYGVNYVSSFHFLYARDVSNEWFPTASFGHKQEKMWVSSWDFSANRIDDLRMRIRTVSPESFLIVQSKSGRWLFLFA